MSKYYSLEQLGEMINGKRRKIEILQRDLALELVAVSILEFLNKAIADGRLQMPDFDCSFHYHFYDGKFHTVPKPGSQNTGASTSVQTVDHMGVQKRGRRTDRQKLSERYGVSTHGSTKYFAKGLTSKGHDVGVGPTDA